jgi:hypothetical protein
MTIEIKDGVIMVGSRVLEATEADAIARANGFQWAEQFVKRNEGKTLTLEPMSLQIKETSAGDPRVANMVLYAWVGEDELGSGEVGLKQGVVPAGNIALVACKEGKIDQPYIIEQLQLQSTMFSKAIRLCRFEFAAELIVLMPEGGEL